MRKPGLRVGGTCVDVRVRVGVGVGMSVGVGVGVIVGVLVGVGVSVDVGVYVAVGVADGITNPAICTTTGDCEAGPIAYPTSANIIAIGVADRNRLNFIAWQVYHKMNEKQTHSLGLRVPKWHISFFGKSAWSDLA